MMDLSPLQKYLMQRHKAQAGMGPRGAGGQAATPVGPGIADPYTEGSNAPPLVNPADGMNEFDSRRRKRSYLDDGGLGGMTGF